MAKNIGRTVFDINRSKILSDPPPKVVKISKCDLMNIKSFCTAKETLNEMKRQPSEREKIFANEKTDKGLTSEIHKQPMKLNIKK